MIAFVDESVRREGIGTYVLGCVLIPVDRCDELRSVLSRLPPFHFNGADATHKGAMLARIGEWGLETSAYFVRGIFQSGGEEAARRACLSPLLLDLRDWGVNTLVLESRRERQNTFDAIHIMAAKTAGLAPNLISYEWRPKAERLLSMADAVAGAMRRSAYEASLVELGTVIREVRSAR